MVNVKELLEQVKGLEYKDLQKLINEAENLENEKLLASFKKREKCMWNGSVYYFCGSVDVMDEDGNWVTEAYIQESIESSREITDRKTGETRRIKYRKIIRKPISKLSAYTGA